MAYQLPSSHFSTGSDTLNNCDHCLPMHPGPYLMCFFFSLGGAKLLAEVQNIVALQSFTVGGLVACSPR